MIPYGKQSINQADIDAVVEVLRSDYVTQGPVINRFEQALVDYCQTGFATATSNATAALHIACLALDVGPGDIVWTSPISFVASSNCALYCGADVDFVDIDVDTANMSIDALSNKLKDAAARDALPKVVIPVHMAGQSCDMQAIAALAKEYGFAVIEDASHAVGGQYQGKPVGHGQFSDICIFSFHPVKIITTAEGGMALTRSAELDQKLKLFRSHGVSRDPDLMQAPESGGWYYQQLELGYNYRMTELQAALGLSQLDRLDEFVRQRHQKIDFYLDKLADNPWGVKTLRQIPDSYSAYHLLIVQLDDADDREAVFSGMREDGIGVNVHYIPIPSQPYYQRLGFTPGQYTQANAYYQRAISLPLYPELSQKQQQQVIDSLGRQIMLSRKAK